MIKRFVKLYKILIANKNNGRIISDKTTNINQALMRNNLLRKMVLKLRLTRNFQRI